MKVVQKPVLGRYDTYSKEELIKLLDAAFQQVPEELRASAHFCIDMDGDGYSECEYPYLYIAYMRPETSEELDREKKQALQQAEKREKWERDYYETLQKKYGEEK